MKYGTIRCECGQEFYFETVNDQISCIKCGKVHDVSAFPVKEDEPAEVLPVEEEPVVVEEA